MIFGECEDTLRIPVKTCNDIVCIDTNYEKMLYDYALSQELDLGYNPYNTVTNESLTFLGNMPGNSFTYHEGDLDFILNHMRHNGYTCDEVYSCFTGMMYGIKNQMEATADLAADEPRLSAGYSFLKNLFRCTGTRYVSFSEEADSLKYCPYKYANENLKDDFQYDSCKSMLDNDTSLTQWSQDYWHRLLDCVINSAEITQNDSMYTLYGPNQTGDLANSQCRDKCQQKRLEIATALKQYYLAQGKCVAEEVYVVGDPRRRVIATDTAQISRAEFLCNIDAILGDCETTFCTFGDTITSEDITKMQNMFFSHILIPADTGTCLGNTYNYNTSILQKMQLTFNSIIDTLSQCYNWEFSNSVLKEYVCDLLSIQICPGRDHFTFGFEPNQDSDCGVLVINDERYLTRYDTVYFPFVPGVHDVLGIDTFYVVPYLVRSDTTFRFEPSCGSPLCQDNTAECKVPCFKWEIRGCEDTNTVDMGTLGCEDILKAYYRNLFEGQRNTLIDKMMSRFDTSYANNCLDPAKIHDQLIVMEKLSYYHYTLYYFDRAGNLIVTVPPKGVRLGDGNVSRSSMPSHTYLTKYRYNSLKQLTWQMTPDGDSTNFFYDSKGNMRFSVNGRQRLSNKFSYTKYDNLYRIIEVGEEDTLMDLLRINDANYPDGTARRYITQTTYNTRATDGYYYAQTSDPQQFIDNRVSYTITDIDGNLSTLGDQMKTIYSYDPHGNVTWVAQKQEAIGTKYLKYEYDLVSGSVLKAIYNEKSLQNGDRFYHKYKYDADKRLREVYTSTDNVNWEKQAKYSYYAHGPLSRVELGQDRVQGTDYVYTIQGWLKGQNTNGIRATSPNSITYDPGQDGGSGANASVPYDVFKMSLKYYNGDFARVTDAQPAYLDSSLYNGNISSWYSGYDARGYINAQNIPSAFSDSLCFRSDYRYDQLNRLVRTQFNQYSSSWKNSTQFGEYYRYDPNGNIDSLFRNNGNIESAYQSMDKLGYKYISGTNKLEYVTDGVTGVSSNDIQNQSSGNYEYDATGNLIKDKAEKLKIYWTPYGKIDKIEKYATTALVSPPDWTQQYTYDAAGNRVSKTKFINSSNWVKSATYYVRDASGNIMAVYNRTDTTVATGTRSKTITVDEVPIYGSDRIGQYSPDKLVCYQTYSAGGTTPTVGTEITTAQIPVTQATSYSTASQNFLYNGLVQSASEVNLQTMDLLNSSDNCGQSFSTFSGIPGNNTALLFDSYGNNIAGLNVMKKYNDLNNFVLLTRNDGNIMINSDSINANAMGKGVMVQKPGSNRLGCLFVVGTDRRLYMNEFDYVSGTVTRKNVVIDTNSTWNGQLAVRTNCNDTVQNIVYARKLGADNTSRLYSMKVYADSVGTPKLMASFRGSPKDYCSGLDISMSGDTLAVMNNKGNKKLFLNTFDTTQVLVFKFNAAHDSLVPVVTRHMGVKISGNDLSYIGTQNIFVTYATNTGVPIWGRIQPHPETFVVQLYPYGTTAATSNFSRSSYTQMYVSEGTNLRLLNPSITISNPITATQVTTMAVSVMPIVPISVQPVFDRIPRSTCYRIVHKKQFELKDHLGNVRAVISDCKNPETANIYTAKNTAEIQNINNYYSFGMPMHRRNYTSSLGSYRFGYNGKEKDDEVKGEGNHNTAEYWEYDPRLGIRWNMDPITYPWQSPYVCLNDNPICFIDPLGLTGEDPIYNGGELKGTDVTAKKYNWIQRKLFKIKHFFTKVFSSENVKESTKFSSHVLSTAWDRLEKENNPWRNRNNIHIPKAGFQTSTSPWMKDFNRAFGTMLNVGVSAPLCIGIAGPALLNTTSPSFVINGGINAGINAGSQYVATGKIDYVDVGAAFFFHKANLMNIVGYSFTAGFFDYYPNKETLASPFLGNKKWSQSIMETSVNGFLGWQTKGFSGLTKNPFYKGSINFVYGLWDNATINIEQKWGE